MDRRGPAQTGADRRRPAIFSTPDEFTMTVPGSNFKTPITVNQVYPFSEEDIKQINYAYCSLSSAQEKILIFVFVIYKF